ncbi:MAG TPA: patatin-like phospholipase family protein [Chitinophagaceae bacterium]|jgi:NTE family protein|nr:patatin-like phospholipase family protein [Chitinophagaceae bacterium]
MFLLQRTISLLIIFSLYTTVSAQSPRNLVFEGAGIRGIAYCGVLQKMEEKNWLQHVQRVGGTSAGAVTALTVALGYTSEEIRQLISSTAFKKLNDGKFMFVGGIARMKKYFGWYRNKKTDEWLSNMIRAKTGNADITFRQMKETGRFKELYVTGTCLNKQELIIFSYETYPDMKIRDAVRISMSIPLYFEASFIDPSGNVFYHPKDKKGLDILVDGGITGNFPIRMFDSTRYVANSSTANQFIINKETVGCRIDSDEQIEKDVNGDPRLAALPVNSLKEYLNAFYIIIIENLNRQLLTKDDWARTISVSSGNIRPGIRKMKKEEIELLINNGISGFDHFHKK